MLDSLKINNNCVNCDLCRIVCPENAVKHINSSYAINSDHCTHCGLCILVCPVDAIEDHESKKLSS